LIVNNLTLALYFTTQSNIIGAVWKNQRTYGQVENWLDQELASFFENDDTAQIISSARRSNKLRINEASPG